MPVTIKKTKVNDVIQFAVYWETRDYNMWFDCCDEQHAKELVEQLRGAYVRFVEVDPSWIGSLRVK